MVVSMRTTLIALGLVPVGGICEIAVAAANYGVELFSADFSDAYFHFRIHEAEWRHTVSPDVSVNSDPMLQWIHMCFGLKAAPLIWCRLAAAVMRLIQGAISLTEGLTQCYLDDPIMIVAGNLKQRRKIICFILLTLRMLGIEVAWHKASRGAQLHVDRSVVHALLAEDASFGNVAGEDTEGIAV